MRLRDLFGFTFTAIIAHRMRSLLTAIGVAVGVLAVVLLTAIGAGLNRYVAEMFTQFGTTTIAVQPGKASTLGISPGVFNSIRPLSLEDSIALARAPYILHSVPTVSGIGSLEANGRERSVNIFGVGPGFDQAFKFNVAAGSFLPPDELARARPVVVLGSTTAEEIFGGDNPLGQRVRVGGQRYRVVGVMESKGEMLGFDLDDSVYIPAARGLEMFNRDGLMEIDLLYAENAPVDEVVAGIRRILIARHGTEDFTIVTQQQMLDTLGSILDVLTLGVGALGGISLLVGGVGIFTIMTIAVRERTEEIGLLRAIGTTRGTIARVFIGEAVMLSGLGGAAGLLLAVMIVVLVGIFAPAIPVNLAPGYILLAESIALFTGLVAGVVPAISAARLMPLEALRTE